VEQKTQLVLWPLLYLGKCSSTEPNLFGK